MEAEKKAAVVKEISFQKQLANAITPTQSMDIWLPTLTDLRRVSDADPAMAAARAGAHERRPGFGRRGEGPHRQRDGATSQGQPHPGSR